MGEVALSKAIDLLADQVAQKVNFLAGVNKQVESLSEELKRLKPFLEHANKLHDPDDSTRRFISELREVALDAEDTIEMFNLNVGSWGFLEGWACYLCRLNSIGEEIESIRDRLDAIDKSRPKYDIKNLGELPGRSEVDGRRRLATWEKDEHLVGIEDDLKKLVEPIMDEDNKGLWVTAVVGIGGIGKSTLAREVYNHPRVNSGRFDCRAWVVVSSEFNPQRTIKQLIFETTESEKEKQDELRDEIKKWEESMKDDGTSLLEKLKKLLYNWLTGKTYFIVLDDVWETEHWESLKSAFPREEDNTSRLLLTTRNNVNTGCNQRSHPMRLLDEKKSWELFLKKGLSSNSNEEFPKELEDIGRDIVKKCGGLPLSITVMGGLLAEAHSTRVWEDALDELNAQLRRVGNNVLAISEAILELSYRNLSPKLKYCFLCLAFFKEDATIPVKRLVNIMVGQGLIQQTESTTAAEDIARGYLDDLINRNMVQAKDLTLDNRVKNCNLHDSLRNICLKKANEEIRFQIPKGDPNISLDKPRHCIVQQFEDLGSFSRNQKKHIRSLFLVNVGDYFRRIESSYWKRFHHLKTLDLDGDYDLQSLPHSFQLLLGLKQLIIRGQHSRRTFKLPTWLSSLKKLELLDMGTVIVEFPNVALKMESLRHICADSVHLPKMTESWRNVETLKYIRQEDCLRLMDGFHVRKLGIFLKGESSSVSTSLEKLKHLDKLCLVWDSSYILPIDAPIIPHQINLTKLKLRGVMRKFPSASVLPPNLSHLTLEESYLYEDPMQELSKLQKLVYLKFKSYSYHSEKMKILLGGFPRLRCLSLRDLYRLRSVDIEEGGMPHLKLLQVNDCPNLDTQNLSNKSYQLQILKAT